MKFRYQGLSRSKEEVSGVMEAENEAQVREGLRAQQIRATEISEIKAGGNANEWGIDFEKILKFQLSSPVKLKQLILFTRQFSSLIDSGVPIVQCLDILYLQEKPKSPLKNVLKIIKDDIESGSSLALALSRHNMVFNEFFIRVIEAGEISGTLDKAVKQVGVQLEKMERLRAKVVGALTYPAITLVVAVGVLLFLLIKVIPEIAKLYAQGNAKLPDITIVVLDMSHWIQANFMYVIVIAGSAFFGGTVGWRVESVRQTVDPLILKVPLIGPLVLKSAVAQLTRTLATLVQSGVPLLTAFDICLRLVKNRAINASLQTTKSYVAEGKTIAQGLASHGIFPPMLIHMVNIGEMTGRLDELLTKVANIYDEEVDDAVHAVTGVLQPAIIVIVGGMIAFLMIAMYLPIFQLADKISGN